MYIYYNSSLVLCNLDIKMFMKHIFNYHLNYLVINYINYLKNEEKENEG